MLKLKKSNLHPKSYQFSESFETFWELQTSCFWIKLNFEKSCNAHHDAQKQGSKLIDKMQKFNKNWHYSQINEMPVKHEVKSCEISE